LNVNGTGSDENRAQRVFDPNVSTFYPTWLGKPRGTLLSIGVATILVLSLLAVLKINGGGRQAPTKELLAGSIPRTAAARKSAPDDPIVDFFASSTSFVTQPAQIAVVDRRAVPLPRPRPKRL
jgi:hypothetical protein